MHLTEFVSSYVPVDTYSSMLSVSFQFQVHDTYTIPRGNQFYYTLRY